MYIDMEAKFPKIKVSKPVLQLSILHQKSPNTEMQKQTFSMEIKTAYTLFSSIKSLCENQKIFYFLKRVVNTKE